MKKENIYKQLREQTETDTTPALTQGELAAIFENEGNPLSQSVISKLENQQKEPPTTSPDVIKAYATHFNVTADYLLGIRDTKSIDENIAMISKVTGLSEQAIETLKQLHKAHGFNKNMGILNFIMSDTQAFALFLNNLNLFIDNEYDIPIHMEIEGTNRKFVENIDVISNSILATGEERSIEIGKCTGEYQGQPLYDFISVPVSILEDYAMQRMQKQMIKWQEKYKSERK